MPGFDSAQQILNIVCNVFDAHSAVLFLPENSGDAYRLSACFSLSDRILKNAAISPGHGLAGWIIRNNEPLLINNFDRKRGVLGYYEPGVESGIRAFMGCPLDKGQGVLCLDSMRTYSFSSKDQKILHQFAQLITSLNVDFCRMEANSAQYKYYHALQVLYGLSGKFQRWSLFLENFLSIVSETAGFPYCFLAARDENGACYFVEGASRPLFSGQAEQPPVFQISSGTVGWVFKNGTPVFTGDKDSSGTGTSLFGKGGDSPAFKSIACLPLVVHRKTRGVLAIASEQPAAVHDDLRVFLQMVASNLALFLENLYLKNRLTMMQSTA